MGIQSEINGAECVLIGTGRLRAHTTKVAEGPKTVGFISNIAIIETDCVIIVNLIGRSVDIQLQAA